MSRPSYDPRHWVTVDGHRYTSVPAPIPVTWKRVRNDKGQLVYVSYPFTIVRERYGKTGCAFTFTVFRDGVELPLSFTGSLWHAKDRAVVNAAGRDVVNHA